MAEAVEEAVAAVTASNSLLVEDIFLEIIFFKPCCKSMFEKRGYKEERKCINVQIVMAI